jgi:septal ring factor EnvC (AmiA/AmiB activator)
MMRFHKFSRYAVLGSFAALCVLGGCTKKPSQEELARLEEARAAAESAERKLAELRRERMALEDQLSQKQTELQRHEEEREDLKQKMEQHQAQ